MNQPARTKPSNRPLPKRKPVTVQDLIRMIAAQYGVDPGLALAVARQESNYNQAAVSPVGAVGVFQLMPATAADLGVNPYVLEENIDGGIRYLSWLIGRYGDAPAVVLAAYNWGVGNVDRAIAQYGNDWLSHAPLETRTYVARITTSTTPILTAGIGGGGETVGLVIVGALLFLLLVS